MNSIRSMAIAALGATLVGVSAAQAQAPGGTGMQPPPPPGMGAGPRGHGHGPGMRGPMAGMRALNLSDDQRAQIGKIREDSRRANWNLLGQMMSERYSMRDLMRAPRIDADAVVAQQSKIDDLSRQLLRARIDVRNRITALLTPDQQRIFREMPLGGQRGGMRGGPGGRRGGPMMGEGPESLFGDEADQVPGNETEPAPSPASLRT